VERRSGSGTPCRLTFDGSILPAFSVSFPALTTAFSTFPTFAALTALAPFTVLSTFPTFAPLSALSALTALAAFASLSAFPTTFAALAAEADVRTAREAERCCGSRECYHASSRHRAVAHVPTDHWGQNSRFRCQCTVLARSG
jgi:hypothetical protein